MRDQASVNVLVSSAGRRGELVRLLGDALSMAGLAGRVFTADRSPLTAGGWLSAGLDLVPSIDDAQFIDAVLDICQEREIRHLVPTIDPELPVYADAQDRFAELGVNVWISSAETVAISQDKRRTNRWLSANALPTVEQIDLSDAPAEFAAPMLAKPARGSSSIGLACVSSRRECSALDERLDYVLETIAPGVEFTVDVLVDRAGRVRATVPRRRIETRAGEVSKGVTVHDVDVEELAAQVVTLLPGAYGILNVQIFKDATTGELNVIEINARVGGGLPLSWASGARLPAWLIEESAGLVPRASLEWSPGRLMLRYDAAVFMDVDLDGLEWVRT